MIDELVSVIMPSYNTADYISDSIKSVQNQTYTNWELIIVDDCSTDATEKVVNSFNDSRIRFFKNEKNSGAAVSRNKALREAKGKWIAFLDSDDLWTSDKLAKQINFMKDNGYHFSYTNYEEIDADGNLSGIKVSGPKKISKVGMFNYCWLGCLTVVYDFEYIGLIQIENIKKNNDYAMWLKIAKISKCYLLNEECAFYRRGRAGSISTRGKFELIKWHYKLYRESERNGVILSVFNTFRNVLFGIIKKIMYTRKYRVNLE